MRADWRPILQLPQPPRSFLFPEQFLSVPQSTYWEPLLPHMPTPLAISLFPASEGEVQFPEDDMFTFLLVSPPEHGASIVSHCFSVPSGSCRPFSSLLPCVQTLPSAFSAFLTQDVVLQRETFFFNVPFFPQETSLFPFPLKL